MSEHQFNRLTEREMLVHIAAKLEIYARETAASHMKTVMALIALAGASIGLKFVGSPWYTVVGAWLTFFSGTFVLGAVTALWSRLTWRTRLIRLTLASFMLTSGITRSFVYHPGEEPAPVWFSPVMDGFFIVLAVLLVYTIWNNWDHPKRFKDEEEK